MKAPTTALDRTADVRAGEELKFATLAPFLAEKLGIGPDLDIRQYPGGHSNLTYLIRAGDRDYVLRRPPFGSQVRGAHDMGREYRVLSKLCEVYDKAPRPLLYCDDADVLGAPFYVMERIPGVVIRRAIPEGLDLDETSGRRICEALVDALVELHAVDYTAVGLADLGKPDGYVERQVSGWSKRYERAVTDDLPEMERVAAWLAANLPVSPAATILHNDFKLDNVVLDPDNIIEIAGVLDWEMCTLGDPLMDVGTLLCYWVEPTDPEAMRRLQICPAGLPGMMTRRELCERYGEQSGRTVDDIQFYYCFGLFKTAVIAQQIYYRFVHGHTNDPRFQRLGEAVRALADRASAVCERDSGVD